MKLAFPTALLVALIAGIMLAAQTESPPTARQSAPALAVESAPGMITVEPSNRGGVAWWVGALVWLPVASALSAFWLAMRVHRPPTRTPAARASRAFVVAAVVACVSTPISLLFELSGAVKISIIAILLAATFIAARAVGSRGTRKSAETGELSAHADTTDSAGPISKAEPKIPRKKSRLYLLKVIHVAIASLLLLSALLAAYTTHQILDSYQGWGPSPLDGDSLRELAESAWGDSGPLSDPLLTVPPVNDVLSKISLFSVNRLAAGAYVICALVFLFVWVSLLSHRWRRRLTLIRFAPLRRPTTDERFDTRVRLVWPAEVRITFAVCFYLSVGGAFAMLYYNEYIGAASKQNAMLAWEGAFKAHSSAASSQLDRLEEDKGWDETMPSRRLELKERSKRVEDFMGQYVPTKVIVQERPRQTTEKSSRKHDMIIDPQLTFHDAVYFSFVSFTTTGYGDIKPVSDALRFMTVMENIMEILFTAMFFVVAMDSGA